MICRYCGTQAEWGENKRIYGRNYGKSYMCWLCPNCGASVGCHQNTKRPLGIMANQELKELRMRIHRIIDPWWKSGKMKRRVVYKTLSRVLGRQYHTADLNEEEAKRLLALREL